jgi:fatty acid desaturase
MLCGNLAIGMSYGWWVTKHNRHHARPNTEDEDPDIMISVVAFSGGRAQASAGLRRLIFRYQAYLLMPMLFLEGASLHGSSVRAVMQRSRRTRRISRAPEAILLTVHFAAYLSVVFLLLSPVRAVLFILIQQGLFGFYLGCSFAPNHKGMPVFSAADRVGFLHRQVLTSRNVRGGPLTSFALGGLNYQIEHHLFPSMPRPSLRRAQPLVAAFCAERGLPYAESSLLGSYAQALRYLNDVGRQTRARRVTTDPAAAAAPTSS